MSNVSIIYIDSTSISKRVKNALNHPDWRNAMPEDINALDNNHTTNLMDLPKEKKAVRCKWVFTIKMNLDSFVTRHKPRLVAKVYTQAYEVDYSDAFSPVVELTSIHLFISITASRD